MSLSDKKFEIAIMGFAIVVVGGMGYLLKAPVQNALGGVDVVYEMPRPKTSFLAALFGLDGREISRTYTNPFAKKDQEKKAAEAAKPTAAGKAVLTAVAQKQTKKTEAAKTPKVEVQIVDAAPETTWADDGFFSETGYRQPVVQNGPAKNKVDTAEEKIKVTSDQWRALLRSQPTSENVSKFLAAYASREVNVETLYLVATDLLSSNKLETEALGVFTLKAAYSVQSFVLATQYLEKLSPEVQAQAQTYLMSYAVTSRLGILAAVLQEQDAQVLTMAMQVVIEGNKLAKSGAPVAVADPRFSRGDVQANSVTGYTQLVPALQQLVENSDGTVSNLASTTLNQIQSTVAAL